MRRIQTIALLFLSMFLIAGFALAAGDTGAVQPKPHQHDGMTGHGSHVGHDADLQGVFGPGSHLHAMAAYLGLSKEQIGKIEQIWTRSRSDSRDVRYDLLQKRIEMHKLFTDPKVTAQTLLAKEKELSGLRQRLTDRRMQALIEARSVLTPEQIQKLDEMPMLMGHGGMGLGIGHGMTMDGMGGCCAGMKRGEMMEHGCQGKMTDGGMGHGMMPNKKPCSEFHGAGTMGSTDSGNK